MKRIFVFCLICSLLLSGCSQLEPSPVSSATETKEEKKASSSEKCNAENPYGAPIFINENEYPVITDTDASKIMGRRLTWENINSFPVKSADMSTDELRRLCADFFRFAKTALWIPDDDFSYIRNKNGTRDQMNAGQVYGGLPYIGYATGNIYRVMDYMDESRGVVDMSSISKQPLLFGNQCSVGSYWGWARVINSARYDWTYNMVASRGFIPVGPYNYDLSISSFNDYTTVQICADNGEQTMFQSYANTLPADGLISNDPSVGHVMMVTGEPVVKYNADGSIDGANSYLFVTDQNQGWQKENGPAGVEYEYKKYIDHQYSFRGLFKANYVPFTFGEFLGTDPVEETVCTFGHEGSTITIDQLKNASVTANYGISDIYAYLKDADGKVLFYKVVRAEVANVREMNFSKTIYEPTFKKYADGNHTVEVVCQLGTGERPTVYTGTLVR